MSISRDAGSTPATATIFSVCITTGFYPVVNRVIGVWGFESLQAGQIKVIQMSQYTAKQILAFTRYADLFTDDHKKELKTLQHHWHPDR